MQITISGKQMETGASLRAHIEEHLPTAVQKYFENAINANVVFSKQGHVFKCHISISEGVKHGIDISADAEADDVYAAFTAATDKAAKQLRRHKRKLKSRSDKVGLGELSIAATDDDEDSNPVSATA
jgi:ribosomal subunit interface protein